MVFSDFTNIKISAVSVAVAEHTYSIEELMEDANRQEIEKFTEKTHIRQIHMCDYKHTAADYSYTAAKVLEKEKYQPDEIGVLINVTQHPDYRTPSTACVLQERLKLKKSCIAFDINLGCSGFVYGVSVAAALLQSSNTQKALVLVGDTLARGRSEEAKKNKVNNTGYLFGDASAAILLEKTSDESNIRSALMTDGSGFAHLACPYGAWKHPYGPENVEGNDIEVFSFAIREIPKLIKEFLQTTNTTVDDYDALALHQANMMIINQIAKRIKAPMDKVLISLDRFGNTSGASIPVCLVDRYGDESEGKIRLLTSGFGVGLSWGVLSFEMDKKDIFPLVTGADIFEDGYLD